MELSAPSDSAVHTKLSGAIGILRGRDTVQRDFDRLGNWAHKNFIRFNKVQGPAPE